MNSAQAQLAAWREQGADRLDPIRFHFIEALARRTMARNGDTRRVLDARLSALLADYRRMLESPVVEPPPRRGRGPLAALADDIACRSPARASGSAADQPAYPELPALDEFRAIWSRLGADRLLRQSRAQVPANAGPLNSSHLVQRSLELMRELSPGYLHHFAAYADSLSWLEQMKDAGKEAPAASPARKSPRRAR
ncbi:DUF2894 domain-containing protein [Pigmentiphaga soli]|uniref:DUF2894 domain-containing protein n=1 Tax=Pigmentiphaga soli TaxID=1007095 RepID=A0ABP8HF72_9BURK